MSTLTTIHIPKDYGYVLLTASASYILSNWLGARIAPFRNAANIPHPHVSASLEAISAASSAKHARALYLFNCAQRAHYNFMENYPGALSGMLITGLTYPKMSAAAGIVWILGRWMYAVGYTSENEDNVGGKGRWWGGGFYLAAVAQVGFLVGVGWMGWDMLQ